MACLVEKLTIARIPLNVWFQVLKYVLWFLYNMIVIKVCFLGWSSKEKVKSLWTCKREASICEASSTISYECDMNWVELEEVSQFQDHPKPKITF